MDIRIKKMLDTDNSSLINWCNILNFIEIHQDELSNDILYTLIQKCEQCRLFWKETGLNIDQQDIYPNPYNKIKTYE